MGYIKHPELTTNVAAINPESIVDGPGVRLTLYLSGCKHNCHNCHNKEEQDFNFGTKYTLQELFNQVTQMIDNNPIVDGITLSGGDPLYQPEIVQELTYALKKYYGTEFSIWLYTGFVLDKDFEDTEALYTTIKNIDVIVDGLYIEDLKDYSQAFRGSTNQRFIDVHTLVKEGQIVELNYLI
jgi:anaerobic ribonucleoside-triphosphate reductase activating protein